MGRTHEESEPMFWRSHSLGRTHGLRPSMQMLQSGQTVSTQPTRPIIKMATSIALTMTLLVFLIAPTPTRAFNGAGPVFPKGSEIFYCFEPGSFSTTRLNTMRAGFDAIDVQASALTITEISWANCEPGHKGILHIVSDPTDCEYMCYTQFVAGQWWLGHEIRVNQNANWWWFQSTNSCLNDFPGDCGAYAISAITHEAMHWIGFAHPGYPGPDIGSCNFHYYSTQVRDACDEYGERLMYAAAADGYYRRLMSDDIAGINAWYDW